MAKTGSTLCACGADKTTRKKRCDECRKAFRRATWAASKKRRAIELAELVLESAPTKYLLGIAVKESRHYCLDGEAVADVVSVASGRVHHGVPVSRLEVRVEVGVI